MCESPKTLEGRYFSYLDVKEPKTINVVPRFHRIRPRKRGTKLKTNRNRTLFTCLSTHVWGFFWIMCESPKTLEELYFSCLDVKEPKTINAVPRFHRIRPRKRGTKLKTNRNWTLFTCLSTHVWGFFGLCASRLRHWRGVISHVWTSKNPKKLMLYPGSIE